VARASEWDDEAFYELLNGPGGPVANLIADLSAQATVVATTVVHVRPGTPSSATTGRTSNAYSPGYTKARIRPHLAWGARTGEVYGGVNAPYAPTTWLETPASQIRRLGHEFPFITTGLWAITLD
jgi:hypothetical protein